MALSDVLNNLTGARDALVTAINGKGGTVAASATLRQCVDAVTALPEGGGGGSSLLQGVAFYSSLTDVETSETADQMQMTGNVTVTSVDGVTSGNFNGNSYLSTNAYKKLPKFSVCVWFNCRTAMEGYGWIFASGDFHYRIEIFNAKAYTTTYSYSDSQGDPEGRLSVPVEVGEWCLLVHTFDSNIYKLFKNNNLIGSVEKTRKDFVPYFDKICFGGVSNSSFGRFDGNISDAIIYNRVLSDEEIAELYALGPGGFSSVWNGKSSSGGDDGGSGESGGGEGGGSSIYTGDLVATVYGTPLGDLTLSLSNTYHSPPSQTDVVWRGEWAGGVTNLYWSSGKWYLDISGNVSGEVVYGGDSFETSNAVPWGATWTSNYETSHTCEVSKA